MRILFGVFCGFMAAGLVKAMKTDVRCDKRVGKDGTPEYEFYSASERKTK